VFPAGRDDDDAWWWRARGIVNERMHALGWPVDTDWILDVTVIVDDDHRVGLSA
jgi:hypothetical protein